MKQYVASIDAGTGGERCVIYDLNGGAVGEAYCEIPTAFSPTGEASQDPNLMIENAYDAVRGAILNAGVDPANIAGLSFCGTQATFIPIDRQGRYIGDIVLWMDMRGMEMFPWIRERLAENGMTEAEFYDRCGHPLDTIASGPKVMWLKQHRPDIYDRTWKFVTTHAMLVRAFGGDDWTDQTCDGSLWLVQDGDTFEIDPQLTRMFDMDPDKYPRMEPACTCAGRVTAAVAERTGLKAGTPLFVGAGDAQCAALGAGNYGTPEIGSFTLGTAGVTLAWSATAVRDPKRTYHIIGYPSGGYSLEAATPVAAAGFRWLRDILYPAEAFSHEGIYRRMDEAAAGVPAGANGVLFLPHLAGMVYPNANPLARGAFAGMSLGTTRADLTRAAMEGVCFEMRGMLEAYRAVGAGDFQRLRLIGGATRSDLWNQMQADVYGCPVETVEAAEASSLGAAIIAATGAGLFSSLKEGCAQMSRLRRRYEPDPAAARRYEDIFAAYQSACRGLAAETFPRLAALRAQEGK